MIVGLVGTKGVGKTTVANILKTAYDDIECIAFADPLKDALQSIFSLTDEQLHDPKQKDMIDPYWQVSPRTLLQIVGTDLFRDTLGKLIPSIGNQIWLRATARKLTVLVSQEKKIIVSDVRFKNEAQLIRDLGGMLIRITRHGQCDSHPSEVESLAICVDVEIHNNGTLNELEQTVKNIDIPV